jgi:outer membrane protease
MIAGVFPVSSYAQDTLDFKFQGYSISFTAGAGVLLGRAGEIVYNTTHYGNNTDVYASQLLWDLQPMVYLGTAVSFSRTDPLAGLGVAADLSVKFGLPLQSGFIEDRDWNNSGELTNYSKHDAYLQGGAAFPLLLDFSGGITIPVASRVAIKTLISFSFMRFSWEGRDGYRKYKSEFWIPTDMSGTGITYEQNWMIFSPGLGVLWPFHRNVKMDFSFFISPLIYANALDTHVNTRVQYFDKMRLGLYVEPSLELTFSPNPYLSLVLHGNWRYITGTRGNTTAVAMDTNASTKYLNSAGAGYSVFDSGLFLEITLPSLSRTNRQRREN